MIRRLTILLLIVGCEETTEPPSENGDTQWFCKATAATIEQTGQDWVYCIIDSLLYYENWESKLECKDAGCETNIVTEYHCTIPDNLCIPYQYIGTCSSFTNGSNQASSNIDINHCWELYD